MAGNLKRLWGICLSRQLWNSLKSTQTSQHSVPQEKDAGLLCTDTTHPLWLQLLCHGKTRLKNTRAKRSPSIFGVKPHLCSELQLVFVTEQVLRERKNPLCTENYSPAHHFGCSGAPHWCSTSKGAGNAFSLGWRTLRLHPLLHPLAGSRWQSILHFHSSRAWRKASTSLTRDQLLFILHRVTSLWK